MNAITPEQDAETDLHWESPNIALEALQAMGGRCSDSVRFSHVHSEKLCSFWHHGTDHKIVQVETHF